MKKFKLRIGVDVDDILMLCNQYAVELANKEFAFSPPLKLDELIKWGKTGGRGDVIFKYYEDESFYKNQPLYEGAKEFIRALTKKAEVFFVTAVAPQFMGERAKRLIADFPEVPASNIIMGFRKDLVDMDIILDDGAHNVCASKSTYPVLMRRPWNQHMTGCLSVNSYDEFLTLVDSIIESYNNQSVEGNKAIALVGPSASGKTELASQIVKKGLAVKVPSYTTRARRVGEIDGVDYNFISMDKFLEMENNGELFESTRYAGEAYGCTKEDILRALDNNNIIMPLDICGAVALKRLVPDKAVLVYVDRPMADLLDSILARDCSNEEKRKRIISLASEQKNEELCHAIVHNNSTLEDAVNQLIEILKQNNF